jgi:hypothetical protein
MLSHRAGGSSLNCRPGPLQSHPHDDFRPAKADVDAEADAKQASTESSQESPTAAGGAPQALVERTVLQAPSTTFCQRLQ